jgi:hypothetical protein
MLVIAAAQAQLALCGAIAVKRAEPDFDLLR